MYMNRSSIYRRGSRDVDACRIWQCQNSPMYLKSVSDRPRVEKNYDSSCILPDVEVGVFCIRSQVSVPFTSLRPGKYPQVLRGKYKCPNSRANVPALLDIFLISSSLSPISQLLKYSSVFPNVSSKHSSRCLNPRRQPRVPAIPLVKMRSSRHCWQWQ